MSCQIKKAGSTTSEKGDIIIKEEKSNWFICFGSFMVSFLIWGILSCYGTFYGPVMQHYGASHTEAGWVGAMAGGGHFLCGIISSTVYESFGLRKATAAGIALSSLSLLASSFTRNINILFLTYGAGFALGTNLIYFPSIVILRLYFKKNLSLANGLVTSGAPIGACTMSPLLTILLGTIGLSWTFRVLALVMLSLGLVFFAYKGENDIQRSKRPKLHQSFRNQFSDVSVWRNPRFVVTAFGTSIFLFGHYITFVCLVDIAIQLGESKIKASLLISYLAIASIFGRIFSGICISHTKLTAGTVFQISLLALASAHLFVPLATSYPWLCLYSVVFGVFEGCIISQQAVIVSEIAGPKSAARGIGFTYTMNSITLIAGPPVAGRIYEATGSYNIAFITAGVVGIIGGLLVVSKNFMKKFNDTSIEYEPCENRKYIDIDTFFIRSLTYIRTSESKTNFKEYSKPVEETFV